jgi:hypothetical protein
MRNRWPIEDHLRWLEQHGEVPQDADPYEWHLAEKTSWWGKPLDPKAFWRGKVIWLDKEAQEAAHRHGRGFPPLPYEDPTLLKYPDDSGANPPSPGRGGPDGGARAYHMTSRERAFWGRFGKTHPHAPDDLEREQFAVAEQILEGRQLPPPPQGIGSGHRTTPEEVSQMEEYEKTQSIKMGYPAEAFSESALYWSYVFHQRQELAAVVPDAPNKDGQLSKAFLSHVAVDSKLITEPLTGEQLRAANAWKITYLQRLCNEKTNESYINAYLQAWNLSAAQVFGGTTGP